MGCVLVGIQLLQAARKLPLEVVRCALLCGALCGALLLLAAVARWARNLLCNLAYEGTLLFELLQLLLDDVCR